MSYETGAYDNEHGDPVVVLVAVGAHDVSRIVNLLSGGHALSEHLGLARQVQRQVRSTGGGQAALALLVEHGGPELRTPVPEANGLTGDAYQRVLHQLAGLPHTDISRTWADADAPELTIEYLAGLLCGHIAKNSVGAPPEAGTQHDESDPAPTTCGARTRAVRSALTHAGLPGTQVHTSGSPARSSTTVVPPDDERADPATLERYAEVLRSVPWLRDVEVNTAGQWITATALGGGAGS